MVSKSAGSVVLLTACLLLPVGSTALAKESTVSVPFNANACKDNAQDKMYIAFLRLVFAFPSQPLIGGNPVFLSYMQMTGNRSVQTRVEDYPPRPNPPRPTEPEGCFGHPAQRAEYHLDAQALSALIGSDFTASSNGTKAGSALSSGDSADIAALQPGNGRVGGGPILWSRSRTAYCGPADNEPMRAKTSNLDCLYRADGGTGAWFGVGRTKPFVDHGSIPEQRFGCSASICNVRAIFEPSLFVRYVHRLDAHSSQSPIDQMTAFHTKLWTALSAAQVRNFPWP